MIHLAEHNSPTSLPAIPNRLDVVHPDEHEPSAPAEDLHSFPDFPAEIPGSAEGQCFLGVDAVPPEHNLLAEALFKFLRIHPRRGGLHRIENAEARLDELGDQFHDGAAGVDEGLPPVRAASR